MDQIYDQIPNNLPRLRKVSMFFVQSLFSHYRNIYTLNNKHHYIRIFIKDHLLLHHRYQNQVKTFSVKFSRPCEVYAAYVHNSENKNTMKMSLVYFFSFYPELIEVIQSDTEFISEGVAYKLFERFRITPFSFGTSVNNLEREDFTIFQTGLNMQLEVEFKNIDRIDINCMPKYQYSDIVKT